MAITIRFTGKTSKMSWVALPVEPACMGKAVGEGKASAHALWCKVVYNYLEEMEEKDHGESS